jgi:hypothetical protein
MLEQLPDGARERIQELKTLSDKAEDGDQDARLELRRLIRESAPEVIAKCSEYIHTYRNILAKTASGGSPLNQDVMAERAHLLALELAGHNPTPLEVLLSERVASLWVLVELQEMLGAAWYNLENVKRPSPAYMLQMVRLQESAHRRYLAAIKTLAQVQKMRGPSRVQVNIGENQVNVS